MVNTSGFILKYVRNTTQYSIGVQEEDEDDILSIQKNKDLNLNVKIGGHYNPVWLYKKNNYVCDGTFIVNDSDTLLFGLYKSAPGKLCFSYINSQGNTLKKYMTFDDEVYEVSLSISEYGGGVYIAVHARCKQFLYFGEAEQEITIQMGTMVLN